jgi:hypothetical protein
VTELTRNIRGLHFYEGMLFVEKGTVQGSKRIKAGDAWIPYK